MASSQIQSRLKDLVSYVPYPALVVNTKKGLILGNNPAAIGKYGAVVSTNKPIRLNGVNPAAEHELLRVRSSDEPFELDAGEEGEFEFRSHSQTIGILIENANEPETQPEGPSQDFTYYPSFHFSYMHRVLTDKRVYPDPNILKQLNLIRRTDEITELNWRNLIIPEDRKPYDRAIAQAVEHGGSFRLRYRVRGLNGEIHELSDFFSVIHEDGMWPILCGTIVSSEGSTHKMQKVERLCLVGRLVGGMIHDFRNLLGGVQNMLEWCMAHSPPEGDVYKAMNKTINYTDQANGLIRCTLRLLDGKSDEEEERISIPELFNDVEGLIRHFGSSTIDIMVCCEDDLPALSGHRSVLLDMLLNLGLNACEAMEEGGDLLRFEAIKRMMPDDQKKLKPYICIRVVDNGCGMSDDQVEAIFKEFYTTKKDGAGLGLWMVQEGARTLGGTVNVTSELGKGSTFEILIPASGDTSIEEEEAPEKPDRNARLSIEELDFVKGRTVLFIEDEPLLRNGVHAWLKTMGFKVHVAADGAEGMDLFKQHRDELDIIIQDFILPGIKGEVLLDSFTAEAPELPVIVCSGYPDGRDYEWIREKGAYAFLSKPFRIEKLVDILRDLFDR